uniref:Pentraxin family member n=1 Tax=Salvator merianae TaxID=96440 RepID=A0A8D0E810_SALMN
MGERNILLLLLLLLLSFSGTQSHTNLDGKVFVFPAPSVTSYVLLKPTLEDLLRQLTVCVSFYTDLTRPFSLFSAASQQHDNEILLFKHSPTEYHISVGGQSLAFSVTDNAYKSIRQWETVCMTWDSVTGIVQLWQDGQPLPRKGAAKGYRIKKDLVFILGQDQDSLGGSFDAKQSFVGEMADLYMWDTVLPPEYLRSLRRDSVPTPLLDWKSLEFEVKGNVVTECALQ